MADSQPPEGLRKIAFEAVDNATDAIAGAEVWHVADAVLAALFDACTVRERWGVRWYWPDDDRTVGWFRDRAEAETERDLPHRAIRAELVYRCDLQTPTETDPPVSSTGEEKNGD